MDFRANDDDVKCGYVDVEVYMLSGVSVLCGVAWMKGGMVYVDLHLLLSLCIVC